MNFVGSDARSNHESVDGQLTDVLRRHGSVFESAGVFRAVKAIKDKKSHEV